MRALIPLLLLVACSAPAQRDACSPEALDTMVMSCAIALESVAAECRKADTEPQVCGKYINLQSICALAVERWSECK